MTMPLDPTWPELLLRLLLTVLAGALIGLNRGRHGHPAGLRTTVLVGLAAAVAMIQANILLGLDGKAANGFATMDIMRLPLGILTGVGFIGGGVILKRGASVTGVTTAATLWIVTAISLCFGGGQLIVGGVATGIAILMLWAAKWVDERLPRLHRGVLDITVLQGGMPDLDALLRPRGGRARFLRQQREPGGPACRFRFEIRWYQPDSRPPDLAFLTVVEAHHRVDAFTIQSETGD